MSKYIACRKMHVVIALLIVSLVSACASGTKSNATQVRFDSNLDVMWEDGLQAIDAGNALLSTGEKRLALGRQQVRDGEAKIRQGTAGVTQAKLEYEQTASAAIGTEVADKRRQADALRPIGKRWEEALAEIKQGQKLIAKGNTNIGRGESEINEGRALMESGSIMMRNAQRSRLGQKLLPVR